MALAAGSGHSLALVGPWPPALRLTTPLYDGGTFTGSLPTVRGRAYFQQYKSGGAENAWTRASAIAGDGDIRTLTDSTAGTPARFYRVRMQ